MSSHKHRKADGREREYDSDRPPVHSSSKLPHTSSSRSKSKSDSKHPAGGGYVSDIPSHPLTSAHRYDTVPSRSKPSRHTHSSSVQLPPTSSAKVASSSTAVPVSSSSRPHKYPEQPTYDSRTYPIRSTSADRSNQPSADRLRATGEHKSSRHRTQLPSVAAATAGTSSAGPLYWPPPVQETPSQKRHESKPERSKDADKAKDKERRREDRRLQEEYQLTHANEQENRRQEEKRRDKEQRRKDKEERRKDDERMQEQRARAERVRVDPGKEEVRERERILEQAKKRGLLPHLLSHTQHTRHKDSDESDNSLRKLGRLPQHRHRDPSAEPRPEVAGMSTGHHREFAVPVSQSAVHGQVLMHRSENVPTNSRETRRHTTPPQASRQLPEQTSELPKRSKHSKSRSEAIPYPPGYATSASDNERASQKDRHANLQDTRAAGYSGDPSSRHGRTRTTSNAPQPAVNSQVKHEHKSGFSHWLFSRSGDTATPKPPDSQYATPLGTPQPPSPAPLPIPPPRVDLISPPPQAVSIRAAQGPSDHLTAEHGQNVPMPSTGNPHRYPSQDPTYPVRPPSRSQGGAQHQPSQARAAVQPPVRPAAVHQSSSEHHNHGTSVPQQHTSGYPSSVPHEDYHEVLQSSLLSPPVSATRVPSNEARSHTPSPYIPSSGPSRERPSYEGHAYSSVTQPAPPPPQTHSTPYQSQRDHLAPPEAYYANAPSAGSHHAHGPARHSPTTAFDQTLPKHAHLTPPSAGNHGHANGVPHGVATTPSNGSRRGHVDPASSFPIHEDGQRSIPQPQYQGSSEMPQYSQPPRQNSHEAVAKERGTKQEANGNPHSGPYGPSVPWYDPRSPKSTKTPSPGYHARSVSQNTPPREPAQVSQQTPVPSAQYLPPAGYDSHANDPSRYISPPQSSRNVAQPAYPAPSGYPSQPTHTHLDAPSGANTHYSANPSASSNVQHRSDNNNPSPRSHMAPPVAPAVTTRATSRTPSYDTGSTTLLGQTPSSQASVLISGMSPPIQGQNILPGIHATQQSIYNGQSSLHGRPSGATGPQAPTTARQPSGRHQPGPIPSPALPASSAAMSPPQAPVRSQSQPTAPRVAAAPAPVRGYTQPQPAADPYAPYRRVDVAGHSSTPAPSRAQLRKAIPSPSPEPDVLRTPSSLARSNTKLPMSPEPVIPASYSQSLNEAKKPRGFFGLFRSKSSAGKRDNIPPVQPDSHAQPPETKVAFTGISNTLPPDYRKMTPAPTHKKGSASVPVAVPGHPPEKKPSSGYPFGFRLLSKRNRTMSAASAEAVDGTVGGASTVITSPAGSTRSPTPKLPPPQRDPVQATQDWRNREEAEIRDRGSHRRRRPGVTFEAYEDHPQAEKNKPSYASRMRTRA
ncbi:hypothetical protein DENSPDRAFT_804984 [Dentipellis sp. KUC8613]|nr:hypothetical protein DENSPDRAFT_804984 [Dentipellis sp. KUC8613]